MPAVAGTFRPPHTFYNALRYTFGRFLLQNWSAFIVFIWGDEPDG
jgi:hypothetical protein